MSATLLPAAHRDLILDDLDEDFSRRLHFAHFWYLAQTLHLMWTRPWHSRHVHHAAGAPFMWTTLWQDVRYGLRTLRKAPGFTAVAVISLAVGIGLNSAIFTIVDNLLFRSLPFSEPERVVSIYTSDGRDDRFGSSSYADLKDLEAANVVFESLIGHSMMFAAISVTGDSRLAFGEVVTANYFSALGIPLALGPGFSAEHEGGEGGHPVVVISDRLWKRGFGGRTDTIGRTMTIKSRTYAVVGVTTPSFTGMMPGIVADLWVPASMVADVEPAGQIDVVPSPTGTTRLQQRGNRWMFMKGRLREGVTIEAAQSNLASIMSGLEQAYPVSNRLRHPTVVPARDVRFHPDIDAVMRPAGAVLMGAVGLVLLIACANLAGMLLARGAARTREMALRSALGAGRTRLVRQMAVESLVLSLLGGIAGLVLATLATSWVVSARLPIDLPITFTLTTDWRLVAFTGALSVATGLVFGILPALKASRPELVAALKDDASLATQGRAFGLRHTLVVLQVAVSVVLLVGGVLLVRSVFAGFKTDPGFTVTGLVTATVSMDLHGYDDSRSTQFFKRASERIRQLPGVQGVSLAERLPFSPNNHTTTIVVDGRPDATPPTGASVETTRTTAEFFETLGVPLVAGRTFDSRDTPESTRVAIISEALASAYFPGGDALGSRVRLRDQTGAAVDIIGISKDYKIRSIGETPRPMIHFAASQRSSTTYSLLVRTSGDTATLVSNMQRELRAIEPDLVFLELGSLERMVAASMLPITLGASVFGGLAGLAMMLAGIGLYGIIAFSVSRRTREIGIRMALGSSRGLVVTRVLKEALTLVIIGTVTGAALAAVAAQALGSVLVGVTPFDPVSYLSAVAVLLVVAVVAAVVPARRAASVDPLIALRSL
ncbi:MAG: ABC transporter permease [Acidobacteria bacterium]|nr:ABC transporter permease [Acidobacteriota bacterium]